MLTWNSCRYEEEKRGPFGDVDDQEPGQAGQPSANTTTKIELLPLLPKSPFGHRTLRNHSASAESGSKASSSGSLGDYKINLGD